MNKNKFFTNNQKQQLVNELIKQMTSSDEVYLIYPFISKKLLNMISSTFNYCLENKIPIKIISTTFDNLSEFNNLSELEKLIEKYPNIQIKVEDNFERKSERIHIKASIFKRKDESHCVIMGSSNLTFSGMVSGREWNVQLFAQNKEDIVFEMIDEFNNLWNQDLVDFNDEKQRKELIKKISENQLAKNKQDIEEFEFTKKYLYKFQKEIINNLKYRRFKGKNKHLLVMATGTGKTLVSAVNYKNMLKEYNKQLNLLFIAHQKEIVDQALLTYRNILENKKFGVTMYEGQSFTNTVNHVFATVQTLSKKLEEFDKKHFDIIIFDEAHHIAANSFDKIFNYFEPKEFIGLTATPEREDGKEIKKYFNDEFACELRIWDAIDQKLLCPFDYYCIDDSQTNLLGIDLNSDKDVFKLINTQSRNDLLFNMIEKYIGIYARPTCLIFCVTTEHAKNIAYFLKSKNLKAEFLTSQNSDQRERIIHEFKIGKINYLCVVNMFNEGIDIPEINTIILLRPTNSKTIYLQQLGRGLRKTNLKSRLEIYDLISNIDNKYDITIGIRNLFNPNIFNPKLIEQKLGLPYDCTITLEKESEKIILNNLKKMYDHKSRITSHIIEYYNKYQNKALEMLLKDYDVSLINFYNYLNEFFYKIAKNINKYNENQNDWQRNKNILKQFIFLNNYNIVDYFYKRLTKSISKQEINLDYDNLLITSCLYEINSMDKFLKLLPNYLQINDLVEEFIYKNKLIVEELITILKYKLDYETLIISKNNKLLEQNCTYTVKQALAAINRTNFLFYRKPLAVLTFQAGYLTFDNNSKQVIFADEDGSAYGKLTKYDIEHNKLFWSIPEKMTLEHKIVKDFKDSQIEKYLFIHDKTNYDLKNLFTKLYNYIGLGEFERMIIDKYLTADFNIIEE